MSAPVSCIRVCPRLLIQADNDIIHSKGDYAASRNHYKHIGIFFRLTMSTHVCGAIRRKWAVEPEHRD